MIQHGLLQQIPRDSDTSREDDGGKHDTLLDENSALQKSTAHLVNGQDPGGIGQVTEIISESDFDREQSSQPSGQVSVQIVDDK